VKVGTVLSLLLFVVFGCNRSEKEALSPLYYDLPAFFDNEIQRQQGRAIRAEVLWEKDGVTEVQKAVLVDWKEAFSAVKKLDMNKTAYRGSYSCDSIRNQAQLTIEYRALTTAVNPQSVRLAFKAGKLIRLDIQTSEKNFLYTSEGHYSYVPDDTLRISGTQQVIFGEKHSYKRSYWY